MRLLVIGGTRFIGRHVVAAALAAGHEVTMFHRGQTGPGLFADAEHRLGDRNGDLAVLGSGRWDATFDTCAYLPRHVAALADRLGGRGGHYLLLSTVSVYDHPGVGFTEDAPLLEAAGPDVDDVTEQTYGALKVGCEQTARARFGPGVTIVRPTYVVGPDDYTWRFAWLVWRMAAGGAVLAPGPPDTPAQLIDVRDLAAWLLRLLADQRAATFHAAGPAQPITWGQLLAAVAATVGPPGTELVWLPADAVRAAGLGARELPLWGGPEPDLSTRAADPAAALAAGLALRPLSDTVRATLAWARTATSVAQIGLGAGREAELIGRWRRARP